MLPAVIVVLASLILVTAGIKTYDTFETRAKAGAFLLVNHASDHLLRAAGDLAVERGRTVGALNMVEPVSADRRDGILRQRAAADQDFSEALESLRGIPEMKGGEKALVEAEQAFRSYASFRQEVDENLNRRLADRAGGVAREFMPTITGLIERIGTLRLTLETLAVAPSADLVQLVQLRALASEMAEYAGRERALF